MSDKDIYAEAFPFDKIVPGTLGPEMIEDRQKS